MTQKRRIGIALWVATVLFMLSAAVYQRLTGPTHRFRGSYRVEDVDYRYRLIRNRETTGEAVVSLPAPASGVTGSLFYRRLHSFRMRSDSFNGLLDGASVGDLVMLVDEPEDQLADLIIGLVELRHQRHVIAIWNFDDLDG